MTKQCIKILMKSDLRFNQRFLNQCFLNLCFCEYYSTRREWLRFLGTSGCTSP